MHQEAPSWSAVMVALQRAAHQTLDKPPLFGDPFAARILPPKARAVLENNPDRIGRSWFSSYVRAALAARSRIAEDALADAVARGVTQYVVLGAGLDTFALRNPHPSVRVFELDHPNTQAFKRQRLKEEGLKPAGSLVFVPVDFERQDLTAELLAGGLDPAQSTFFSWLGVTPYLELPAIEATLRSVASLAGREGGIAFDFFRKLARRELLMRFLVWLRSRRLAKRGEPFRTHLDPSDLRTSLASLGFASVDVLGPSEINARYFAANGSRLRVSPIAYVAVAARVLKSAT